MLINNQIIAFVAVIEQTGIPALRIAFSIAVAVFLLPESSSSAGGTNFSIAIRTWTTMSLSSATIVWKKSSLFGLD